MENELIKILKLRIDNLNKIIEVKDDTIKVLTDTLAEHNEALENLEKK